MCHCITSLCTMYSAAQRRWEIYSQTAWNPVFQKTVYIMTYLLINGDILFHGKIVLHTMSSANLKREKKDIWCTLATLLISLTYSLLGRGNKNKITTSDGHRAYFLNSHFLNWKQVMLQTKPQLNLILNREFNPLNIIWLPHVAEMIVTLWSSLKSELMRTLNCLPVSAFG